MSELITQIFSSFQTAIAGMTTGIKDAFGSLLYVDASVAEPVLSPLAIFVFVMLGLSMALGVVSLIFNFIKQKRRG